MRLLRFFLPALLACKLSLAAAEPASPPFVKYKFNVPPSAELNYSIRAKQNGISLGGVGVVRWIAGGKKFSVAQEAHAMLLGRILDSKTEGLIDDYGLAPQSFIEKRIRRD